MPLVDAQTPPTVHASAIVLGRFGVLIEGASGAGKTRLADALIYDWLQTGHFARWIADDRVVIDHSTSTANTPPTIAGQKEHAYLGIVNTPHLPAAKLDLVVRLVPPDQLDRMPQDNLTARGLPLLCVPERALSVSVPLVNARLAEFA